MASCEGCGREVRVAGGIGDLWTFDDADTGGLTLEFEDGTEYFLCFDCLAALPEAPTAADVEAIEE